MNAKLLDVMTWVLFLGGVFGLSAGLVAYFGDAEVAEFAVMGIGGGFWMLSSAITILIRDRVDRVG
jgi:hypothetical protein